MKILVVAPWVPTSRRPRSLGLISLLAASHEVHLICIAWSQAEADEAKLIDFAEVQVVMGSKYRGVVGAFMALFSGSSLQQGFVSSTQLGSVLASTLKSFTPDMAYFNVIRSAHLVDHVLDPGVTRVLDMDEERSRYYGLLASYARPGLTKLIARIEARAMKRAERVAENNFDRILVSSPQDSDRYRGGRLVRSPHHMNSSANELDGLPPRSIDEVIFVGRLSYYANVEAIRWFAQNVWPIVISERPTAKLRVVGENPTRAVRRLTSQSIQIVGPVKSVEPHYRRASLSVVPVAYATGAQMKLIESMALGTPAVVTPIVLSGIGASSGEHCESVERDKEAWARQVLALLNNAAEARALGERASFWAQSTYSSQTIGDQLASALKDSNPRPRTEPDPAAGN